ncbi:hypothetical protein SAMN02927930_01130 [Pseudidiomarina indica]|uniref:YcgL domain-containing protein SAMN02927930_01130 n=1 Tax=Pseudidiomarina indica TaxID=1159017 RepID=A0A1G6C8N3_9GAMM|nr:YcgL domain-containing protein [Pseudidiomarina indica]SDB29211.1 hypothetical protein SAMN02927930_01130 [Pseudidiomarina indica]
MLCAIYRSPRRADTYLYLSHPADFTRVPEPLRDVFGTPVHVMTIALTAERRLARLSVTELTPRLEQDGYYLQMPLHQENLLDLHKKLQQESKSCHS